MSNITSFDDLPFEQYGLGHLTAVQREEFQNLLLDELQFRVGETLSRGLSREEFDEFEAFMDRVPGFGLAWLEANAPGFRTEDIWPRVEASQPTEEIAYAEMASLVWLGMKRPNFRDVVKQIHAEIMSEVKEKFSE